MRTIRRLLVLSKPYMGRIILAGVCSAIASGLNGTLAWLVKPAVDKVFIEKKLGLLLAIALAVLIVFLSKAIFAAMQSYLMKSVGAKMVRDIRNRLYEHSMQLPMSFFSKDSTGALLSRTINDAGAVQGLLASTLKDLFVESCTAVVLIGVAMYMSWDMTLIAIVILPVAFYGVSRLSKKIKSISKKAQEKISKITEILTESFLGIRIIKSFCRENNEVDRFKGKNQDYYRELMRSVRIFEATSIMMEVVAGFGIAFVIWYGGNRVIQGAMTPGEFFAFFTAIFMI